MMTMNDKLQNLDWVKARSSCSLAAVFEELKSEIKRDVETRNGLIPPQAHYHFRVTEKGNEIRVHSESNLGPNPVVFTLTEKAISVQTGKGKPILEATVTLNHEGRCVAKVNGTECEFWQMRHRALEELFFETF